MKIYLAGPMSGLPEFNYPAFHSAAERLRAMGHEVENPAENDNPSGEWSQWMRLAIAQVVICDGLALLDGWKDSPGAKLEVEIATKLNITVRPLREWVTA